MGEEAATKGYEEQVGQLDLQLTYLWRVHSLDYYGGAELQDPADVSAAKRTLRGPRPEEGEQPDEAEGGAPQACSVPACVYYLVRHSALKSL